MEKLKQRVFLLGIEAKRVPQLEMDNLLMQKADASLFLRLYSTCTIHFCPYFLAYLYNLRFQKLWNFEICYWRGSRSPHFLTVQKKGYFESVLLFRLG